MTSPIAPRRDGAADIVSFPRPPRRERPVRPGLDPAAGFFRNWLERIRCRRELRNLALFQPDSVLEDVGLTRREAQRLSEQPAWPPWRALFSALRGGS